MNERYIRDLLHPPTLVTSPATTHISTASWMDNPARVLKRRLERLTPGQVLVHDGIHVTRSKTHPKQYLIAYQRYTLADAVTVVLERAGAPVSSAERELSQPLLAVLREWRRQLNAAEQPSTASISRVLGQSDRTIARYVGLLTKLGYMERGYVGKGKLAYTLTEKGEQA